MSLTEARETICRHRLASRTSARITVVTICPFRPPTIPAVGVIDGGYPSSSGATPRRTGFCPGTCNFRGL